MASHSKVPQSLRACARTPVGRFGATAINGNDAGSSVSSQQQACRIRALEIASSEPSKGLAATVLQQDEGSSGSAPALMKSGILRTRGGLRVAAWRSADDVVLSWAQ